MDKEIIEIYKERKNRMIELLETMDWEQAVKIVDGEDYQDRIDDICYPNGKKKEYEPLILTKSYYENPEKYPKYDNYDAINVDRVTGIPYDYEGVMGVPITFCYYLHKDIFALQRNSKNISEISLKVTQFKIIGLSASAGYNKDIVGIPFIGNKDARCLINGKKVYARILIQRI